MAEKHEINGNTEGIRSSALNALKALYDMRIDDDCFAPVELLDEIAAFSSQWKREVSVYISREGRVLDITAGGGESVPLSAERLRRNPERLSMIRCVHTHPEGEARLSGVDRQALRLLKFDAMAALSVHDGRPIAMGVGFLGEWENGEYTVAEMDDVPVSALPQEEWMRAISEADARVYAREANQQRKERALLISADSERSLEELKALADTAGAETVGTALQRLPSPDPATYIGSGKVEELSLTAQALNVDMCVFDDELSGAQLRNLEERLGCKCVDRTGLILDIFAQRARSREGILQVELAQLQYTLPRLQGQGASLSRLAGGIGTRGPGESQLEQDRRHIRRRMGDLKAELDELRTQRTVQRRRRQKNGIPVVALVGYTNAGKSTLLNALAGADVFCEDKLFATLDTTTRRLELGEGQSCLLTDTVGFINKLPHDLVSAFRATLEEAAEADLLVIVNDVSDPDCAAHRKVVDQVLNELGAVGKPTVEAYNKCDRLEQRAPLKKGEVYISARTGEGLEELVAMIKQGAAALLRTVNISIPYDKGSLLGRVYSLCAVTGEEYTDTGTLLTVRADAVTLERLARELPAGSILPDGE